MRSFASDNNAGVHPAIMAAIMAANVGHAVGYGDDPWTREAEASFRRVFGQDIEVFFVLLGTGANVLSLSALARPFEAVVCARAAHVNVDECGAPERFCGCKILEVEAPDGRLTPEAVRPRLLGLHGEHHSQPRVLTVTQCTELGAVYRPEAVRALADLAHEHGLHVHMDGARLANAAVALNLGLAEVSRDCGVDVLSFGGTKNGLMFGEAVVFFRPGLARDFRYIRKQGMQLASKMRFISAQFPALLDTGLWRENARQANAMAGLLAGALAQRGIAPTRPVEANAVFARLAAPVVERLREEFFFYTWDPAPEDRPEVRFMCSFDTTEEDVRNFAAALDRALG